MGSKIITRDNLLAFCEKACVSYGFSAEDAAITAKVLTDTDLLGVFSHGTKNLHPYLQKTAVGGINNRAALEITGEGEAWARADGQAGMGPVVAYKAMRLCMEKAAKTGVAFVAVKNSTHFGAAGYYSTMAAAEGMFGMAMSNTEPNMAVPGGKGRSIGNSPFSYAFPNGESSIFLDVALSETAALKVIKAAGQGQEIPGTWIVDKNGCPSSDPGDFFDGGALQPMSAHKGYGFSMMVELLTGLISGGSLLHEMTSWCFDLPASNKVSHAFLALDIRKFIPRDEYQNRIVAYTEGITGSPRRTGCERIYLPGEIELGKRRHALEHGLELPTDVAESLTGLSRDTGIAIEWCEDA